MNKHEKGKQCPSCESNSVLTTTEIRSISLPYGRSREYPAVIDECSVCGFRGDFHNENEKVVEHILSEEKKILMRLLIESFMSQHSYSMAYLERALKLAPRTMMRWKNGSFADPSFTLMQVLARVPWMVEVADENYDQSIVNKHILETASRILFNQGIVR